MFVVACLIIAREVLHSINPRTASSSPASHSQERPDVQKGRVTAIMYSSAKVSAIVGSRLVHEGDTLGDVKVVKIEKHRVHFRKRGIQWSQTLQDQPSKNWK